MLTFDEVILNPEKCNSKLFTRSLDGLREVVSHSASWAVLQLAMGRTFKAL